jgi:hypothetical protein
MVLPFTRFSSTKVPASLKSFSIISAPRRSIVQSLIAIPVDLSVIMISFCSPSSAQPMISGFSAIG